MGRDRRPRRPGPRRDPRRLVRRLRRSWLAPITHLDRVTTPLIVFQGANDVRVVQAESDNVVDELGARGVEVDYRVFTDEGHLFAKSENLVEMIETAGRLLAEHLS
ncbi:MAG TPA: prolyl oligopeptidase family serine peptidase [Actinomycetospora sp.]|nr:prolyl oligopeptidase family serine peptidase [Actinomycetospora sp.]